MGRPEKFEGLQQKFEDVVVEILSKESGLSGKEIVAKIQDNYIDRFIDEEIQYLSAGINGFLNKAVNTSKVIESFGPWKGYGLFESSSEIHEIEEMSNLNNLQNQNTVIDSAIVTTEPTSDSNEQWESLVHLASTMYLSRTYEANVLSLPKFLINNGKWLNPDQLFVKYSNVKKLLTNQDEQDIISLVHDEVPFRLAAVELKISLGKNRAKWLEALMEVSINGIWANETWLINFDFDASNDSTASNESIASDCLEFARQNGIGIINVAIKNEMCFDFRTVVEAAYRRELNIANLKDKHDRKKTKEKATILTESIDLIRDFQNEGYIGAGRADLYAGLEILNSGIRNLRKQTGFQNKENISDHLNHLYEKNPKRFTAFAKATEAEMNMIVSEFKWRDFIDKLKSNSITNNMKVEDLTNLTNVVEIMAKACNVP